MSRLSRTSPFEAQVAYSFIMLSVVLLQISGCKKYQGLMIIDQDYRNETKIMQKKQLLMLFEGINILWLF